MRKPLIFILALSTLFYSYSLLNAIGDENEETNTEKQDYNPADYDPGIPLDWIKEDGTFGE